MSFARYPGYKDSGVEWLGEVPGHWAAGRFSRVIFAIKDGTHGTFNRTDDGVPFLSAKNVAYGNIDISDAESQISIEDHESITTNGFPQKDDLLLTIVGTIGRACIYPFEKPMAFQRSVCFIRFTKACFPQFFYYFTQSKFFQEQLMSKSKSSAQAGVYMGDVCATSVAYPTERAEQQAIATFLDTETAKIDGLMAEQRALVALLKEKRQAVISHAVTKGLNPAAPMKDSGVDWLGEVPGHWEVLKATQIGELFGSEQVAEELVSELGNIPFIKVGSLSLTKFAIESWDWFVEDTNPKNYKLRNNFVVFPKRGAAIYSNKVNIVDRPSLIDPNLMGWEIGSKAIPRYIAYALKTRKVDELADVSTVCVFR